MRDNQEEIDPTVVLTILAIGIGAIVIGFIALIISERRKEAAALERHRAAAAALRVGDQLLAGFHVIECQSFVAESGTRVSSPFRRQISQSIRDSIQEEDKLTGLLRSQIRESERTVDHIIEIQMWDYVWDQVEHLAGHYQKYESIREIKEIVNNKCNLTVTPHSVNVAKGNAVARFLEKYKVDKTNAPTLAECAKNNPLSSHRGGAFLHNTTVAMSKAYYRFARQRILSTLTDRRLAGALVWEFDRMLKTMGIPVNA